MSSYIPIGNMHIEFSISIGLSMITCPCFRHHIIVWIPFDISTIFFGFPLCLARLARTERKLVDQTLTLNKPAQINQTFLLSSWTEYYINEMFNSSIVINAKINEWNAFKEFLNRLGNYGSKCFSFGILWTPEGPQRVHEMSDWSDWLFLFHSGC